METNLAQVNPAPFIQSMGNDDLAHAMAEALGYRPTLEPVPESVWTSDDRREFEASLNASPTALSDAQADLNALCRARIAHDWNDTLRKHHDRYGIPVEERRGYVTCDDEFDLIG